MKNDFWDLSTVCVKIYTSDLRCIHLSYEPDYGRYNLSWSKFIFK